MNNVKWVKRKYTISHKRILSFLDDEHLKKFKIEKYKFGELSQDIIYCQRYKKGSPVMFKRTNPVNDYNHPAVYLIIKCQDGYTQSGYHMFMANCDDITEIKK